MLHRSRLLLICLVAATAAATVAPLTGQGAAPPGIDDLLNLKRVAAPAISPDGQLVAYTVRETNWDENAYETEIWLGDAKKTRQLTNAKKSSVQPAWSRDGRRLAFISDRDGKRQVYRIDLTGGEAERLTTTEEEPRPGTIRKSTPTRRR